MAYHLDAIISDNQYHMLVDVIEHANMEPEETEELNEIIWAIKESKKI